jgi:DNA-binding beta-propeller fold protein YncE
MRRTTSRACVGALAALCVAAVGLMTMAGCGPAASPSPSAQSPGTALPGAQLKTPKIGVDLPDKYNTPDGMTVDAQNNIILSCPNFNDPNFPAVMLKVGPDDKVTELVKLTGAPGIGKAGPLGVTIGSDGNLYIADNPAFGVDKHLARLLRVVMKDGKAEKIEVVATNFINSNGVAAKGDWIYVCESKLDPNVNPMPSGVYGFKISELDAAKPIVLLPGGKDPHLAIQFTTKNKEWKVGANGLAFDAEGNMLVCNFGDGQILKAKMGPDGKAVSWKVLAEDKGMLSTDGLSIDKTNGDIYVADFVANAVHKIDPKTGKVTTIAKNGNSDGAHGELHRPSEPCVRGNKVYVSNISLPLVGNKYGKPHTLSVVDIR